VAEAAEREECVEEDMKVLGLKVEDAQVRLRWGKALWGDCLTRARMEQTDIKPVIIIIIIIIIL
jgi:hypothetical protein